MVIDNCLLIVTNNYSFYGASFCAYYRTKDGHVVVSRDVELSFRTDVETRPEFHSRRCEKVEHMQHCSKPTDGCKPPTRAERGR